MHMKSDPFSTEYCQLRSAFSVIVMQAAEGLIIVSRVVNPNQGRQRGVFSFSNSSIIYVSLYLSPLLFLVQILFLSNAK